MVEARNLRSVFLTMPVVKTTQSQSIDNANRATARRSRDEIPWPRRSAQTAMRTSSTAPLGADFSIEGWFSALALLPVLQGDSPDLRSQK